MKARAGLDNPSLGKARGSFPGTLQRRTCVEIAGKTGDLLPGESITTQSFFQVAKPNQQPRQHFFPCQVRHESMDRDSLSFTDRRGTVARSSKDPEIRRRGIDNREADLSHMLEVVSFLLSLQEARAYDTPRTT